MKNVLLILFMSASLNVWATQNAPSATELNESNIEVALAERDQTKQATENAKSDVQAPKLLEQKESEIPVVLEAKKSDLSSGSPFAKMLLGLCLFAGLSFAAWLALRKYKLKNRAANPATQLKVIAQHHLGPKKSLAIIRVAGESILVGITDHHISLIKPLSLLDEEIPEETPQNFGSIFRQQEGKDQNYQSENDREQDDFSFAGVRDVVSAKIKGMRSLQ